VIVRFRVFLCNFVSVWRIYTRIIVSEDELNLNLVAMHVCCRNLRGMGLSGTLPPEVMNIAYLEALMLSNNDFYGTLPPQWSSKSLRILDLANNRLSGPLPVAYGSRETFPRLTKFQLDGNSLSGVLPGTEWLSIGFAPQAVIAIRPGNRNLCGPVPVVDPKFYSTMPGGETFPDIIGPTAVSLDSSFRANTSQVYLVYKNLLSLTEIESEVGPDNMPPLESVKAPSPAPEANWNIAYSPSEEVDTGEAGIDVIPEAFDVAADYADYEAEAEANDDDEDDDDDNDRTVRLDLERAYRSVLEDQTDVVITNTLGICSTPCGETATLSTTNLLEASWSLNVTLQDMINYNPGLSANNAKIGTQLALPCYDLSLDRPTRQGSDVALGMFAGGNQKSVVGTVGAEMAGAVVRGDGLGPEGSIFYEGIMDWKWEGDGMSPVLVEPVYWFVDLDAVYTVTGLSITSGNQMRNISVYVGNNLMTVFGNNLVASGLDFASGETRVIPVDRVRGRIVILYSGPTKYGTMSLSNVKVWSAESNAAVDKTILVSNNAMITNTTNQGNVLIDGNPDTCMGINTKGGQSFSVALDAEYNTNVAMVMLNLINGKILPGSRGVATVYVSDFEKEYIQDLQSEDVCGEINLDGEPLQAGISCNKEGQYVGVHFEGLESIDMCEFDVYLTGETVSTSVSSSDVVAIAVGSAIAGAFLALLIVVIAVYLRRRRRRKLHVTSKLEHDAEKGTLDPRKDSLTSNSADSNGIYSPKLNGHDAFTMDLSMESPTRASRVDSMTTRSSEMASLSETCDLIKFSDIELVRTIGEGSYGLVWLGRYLQTSVAVKILTHDTKKTANWTSGEAPSEAALQALRREASIMASLRHPNCVQYLGCCLDPPALVMEYCSRRSVDQILQEARDDLKSAKQLDWFRLLSIATDAAKGMLYLHSRNPPIVHRDLKSPNLLVDGQWHVKISDFNLSRAMEQDSLVSSLQITNPRWLAPEILRGEKGGKASDVYSFGVVLWELLTWKLPWDGEKNPFSIINRVLQKKSLAVPGCQELPAGELQYYESYVSLMKRCWEWDPVDRPTMDSIVQELRTLLAAMVQSKIDTGSH